MTATKLRLQILIIAYGAAALGMVFDSIVFLSVAAFLTTFELSVGDEPDGSA